MPFVEAFRRDAQTALRAWRQRRLLLIVVILTLGLGFSATSVIFSVVNAVLLAPLPYGRPEGLVVIRAGLPGQQQAVAQLSGPEVIALEERAALLAVSGAVWARPGVLGAAPAATEIEVGWITPGFLQAFDVPPQLGRLPTRDEHRRTDIIVLSDSLWRQRFGADPSIVGRRIDFDDEPRTVVAVMPPRFRMLFPLADGVPDSIEAWLPWGSDLRAMTRGFRVFTVIGRVDEGATVARQEDVDSGAINGELEALAGAISRESAAYARSGFTLAAEPLQDALAAPVRPTLVVLLCVVALVWVIACANVANLLLIRGIERSTEFAVRLALGVGRSRLWRQVLTESGLIGSCGAAAGLLFAYLGITLLRQLDPAQIPRVQEVAIGVPTLAAGAIAALLAALFFGSVAARQAVASTTLHQQARGASARTSTAQRLLVVTQVALSVVLLTGAGLLVRSVAMLRSVELGFKPDAVVSMRISLPDVRYPYETAGLSIAEFYRRLDEMLLQIPGTRAAGATLSPPLAEAPLRARPYAYRTTEGETEWGAVAANYRTVTPGWFAAAGVQLVSGRLLDDRDRWDRPVSVVVDRTLAEKAWPGREAIGQQIKVELFRNSVFSPHWGEVVGVVEPVRLTSLVRREREQVYVAHHQSPQRTMFPALLTGGDPLAAVAEAQRAVHQLVSDLPVFDIQPYATYVDDAMAQTRFAMIALSTFALLAIVLAAGGLFAALSAFVTMRTREIGVRLALGSTPGRVFRWTLARGLMLTGAGVSVGLVTAVAFTRFLTSLLFNVSPTDGLTIGAVTLALIVTAAIACSLPAAKAAYIDPSESLKS
jgi:predicted permease